MTDPTPDPEPAVDWDAAEERTAAERQDHLVEAILYDAGCDQIDDLPQVRNDEAGEE